MLSKLLKPLTLPPQLQWEYAHESALIMWTIKAQNYNTFVANIGCVVFSLGFLVFLYTMHRDGEDFFLMAVVYFLAVVFAIVMFHQPMNTAYRLTPSGIECCEWKDFPRWMLTFLNWFAGISAIICIWLVSVNPAFLLGALVGPGGMGLMYWAMANSKSHQELYAEFHHQSLRWADVTQLAIASNREVVDLQYCVPQEDSQYMLYWNLNIFCKCKEKEKVAVLIKPYLLPDIPCIVAKVNVPLSTD